MRRRVSGAQGNFRGYFEINSKNALQNKAKWRFSSFFSAISGLFIGTSEGLLLNYNLARFLGYKVPLLSCDDQAVLDGVPPTGLQLLTREKGAFDTFSKGSGALAKVK